MDVRFPSSALKAAADAAAAAARPARDAGIGGPAGLQGGVPGLKPAGRVDDAVEGGFSTVLTGALKTINAAQVDAASRQQAFEAGAPGATLEGTMVSMQKAQIGFQAAVTVRNRLVAAYTDIMNMPV